ncbi:hypothetical protein AUF12_14045 [Enterococcus avium]|uniref:DUF5677 domain-containing protein n=1 Tax=Enterococcus avium TaxID=33945 RepID=UPI000C99FEC7|nr:DUF5677 domain-containing protein [Enterococcus avium]PNE51543.1 hypothetical protein AUF12_14045 [Enterococcus avium]
MPLTNSMMKNYLEIGDIVAENEMVYTGEVEVHDIVIRILYVELLHKVDDVLFLLDNKRTYSIDTILRTCTEMTAQLKYILLPGEKDKKTLHNRARACFYWNKITNANKAQDMLNLYKENDKTSLEQKILTEIKKIKPDLSNISDYKSYYEDKLNACYSMEISKKKRGNWYNHDGSIQGIRDLFKYVDMESEYVNFYRTLSDATHGVDALTYLVTDKYSFGTSEHLDNELIKSLLNSYLFEITKLIVNYYKLEKEVSSKMKVIEINFKRNFKV